MSGADNGLVDAYTQELLVHHLGSAGIEHRTHVLEGCGHQDMLKTLQAEDRVAFRYTRNPNGAMDDIAGVLSANRRVLGMMPHPERAVDAGHGGTDGQAFFRGLIGQLAQA